MGENGPVEKSSPQLAKPIESILPHPFTTMARIRDTRRIRARLFGESDGLCQFCGVLTILPDELVSKYEPVNPKCWTKQVENLLRDNAEFRDLWHSVLATIEHVLPLGAGGTWDRENLKLACYSCNHRRARIFAHGLPASQKRRGTQHFYWSVINERWMPIDGFLSRGALLP